MNNASNQVKRLQDIPPFTLADWADERDSRVRGRPSSCPNCGHAENYDAYSVARTDGTERRYRACKSCGCWQETDGTPAYRCALLIHSCTQPILDGVTCKNCDQWGPRPAHRCHRILPTQEIGVTKCRQCEVVQTVVHVVGWPVRAE